MNCETELDLSWAKYCVLIEHHIDITGLNFMISNTKFYIPVVTFSITNNNKLLKNLKQGFKGTISWNKFRSELTTQLKNNDLDYMIVSKFRSINCFCFFNRSVVKISYKKFFDKHFMLLVEINCFNVLISNEPFFHQNIKKQGTC